MFSKPDNARELSVFISLSLPFFKMCERAEEMMIEQAMSDALYHVEAQERPALPTDKPLFNTKRK